MPLNNIAIRNAGPGRLSDGRGLILIKASDKSGSWVYRYQHMGRRRDMGLGSWPHVSLAQARAERDKWAALLSEGQDPIAARNEQREAQRAARDRRDPTFAEMVGIVFEARSASLRANGRRGRWRSPLDTHVIPRIGARRMSTLHQTDIKDALAPIWRDRHPTAIKALRRIRIVLREARAMGIECDPSIADAAEHMLGIVRHEVRHIVSTPWQDIPALYQRLRPELASHLCLRWMILTLVRSDGCRGARRDEIDGDLWTVPADRVKGIEGKVKAFRVPLSEEAQAMAAYAPAGSDLLFPGLTGAPITTTGLQKALNDLGEAGRPHGFRSSFRSWVQETDAASYDVAETILGHKVGSLVERSYARSDLLERRRPVMEAWARHVTGANTNVITLGREA